MSDDLCQCPPCGRTHRNLGFGKPPEAIAGPSLLRPAEAIAPAGPQQESLHESVARGLFGHSWRYRRGTWPCSSGSCWENATPRTARAGRRR